MSLPVFAAVLLGALLHASWNAIVKAGTDKLLSTVLVSGGSALIALPFALVLPAPAPASWPFLAASTLAQLLYFVLVATAYRAADMSLVYPLMRGGAPALVALAGALALGERIGPAGWLGVALVSLGVLAIAGAGRAHATGRGVAIALGNACVIATYTLIDGAGVRRSGAPVSYALWLFLANAAPFLAWALLRRGPELRAYLRAHARLGLVGGAGNLGSYGLALWAMTGAPVAVVAALRETSILFGLAIAALFLGERIGPVRLAAAALILAGAITLRLG
ncbi:EamA family transporter [Amaricoccus solimangrovi]|uniref:EamA family transporter n=1 Tax=Amaricoccus solimangrovi TaxID=2589815 RepID=A0A501WPW1_9RHOB|nr:EamA family transporter [Amaricoccus solimangrovi]TPE51499.1 EamA family transporter [Amaricoccus solimangrovi]